MASSRRIGTNENVSTYGNGTRDYTSLATWEAATDNDLVTATQSEVLACCADSASFDDYILMDGATTSSSYFRIIRVAGGHGHSGTPATGFKLINTTDAPIIRTYENYASAQDLILRQNINSANDRAVAVSIYYYTSLVGLLIYDSANAGSGSIIYGIGSGITSSENYTANCLVHNCEGEGFRSWGNGGQKYFYSCVATNNGTYGFSNADDNGNSTAKNCTASGNGTADWYNTWIKTTCTAEGATPSYVDSANDNFLITVNDSKCMSKGTNLSADAYFAFDDDILKVTRAGTWDIGFHNFTADHPFSFTEGGSNPILDPTGTPGDFDQKTVRDAHYVKHDNGTFSIVYTGYDPSTAGSGRAGIATCATHGGAPTRQGYILQNAQCLYDSFTGSDATNLTSHAPDEGLKDNWNKVSGDDIVINTNRAKVTSYSAGNALYYLTDYCCSTKSASRGTPSGEHRATFNLCYIGGIFKGGVILRYVDSSNYLWFCWDSSDTKWKIISVNAGTPTELSTYTQSITQDQVYAVEAIAKDGDIELKVDTVSRCTSSSTAHDTDVGKVGLKIDNTGGYIDELKAFDVGERHVSDPFVLWDSGNSLWHLWYSFNATVFMDAATYGHRVIPHFTASGTANVVPLTGWVCKELVALKAETTGWTRGPSSHRSGVAQPKVVDASGGGYIMFMCNWGNSSDTYAAVEEYKAGYASADSLDGPWTLGSTLFGTASGYQVETPVPVKFGTDYYCFINRLGLAGRSTADDYGAWPQFFVDLWKSTTGQTGTYSLVDVDIFNRYSSSWADFTQGIVSLVTNIFNDSTEAIFDGGTDETDMNIRSIGIFTLDSPPFTLTATNVDSAGCNLDWTVYGATYDHYEVHRSESTPIAGDAGTRIADNQSGQTYHDESADPATTYYYCIIAKNGSDEELDRTNEEEVTTESAGALAIVMLHHNHFAGGVN